MSAVTSSPLSPEAAWPALTAATPSSAEAGREKDAALRSRRRPPPVHAGADWQVLLHLPQTEAWLRASEARVAQLTRSAAQDGSGRHVDAHLLQLKEICEDISDHVEPIHALLETELSLKLLSYSVNILVDIRTVQLLWHQLRVSVLVLKERLLQGLRDPNGNFTRQTDILQAFGRGDRTCRHQTRRLDALTEVDDCGQLTIRCTQDYFSLDCGITAFELSDYSPGDEPQTPENRSPGEADSEKASPELVTPDGSLSHTRPVRRESKATNQSEAAKRSLPGGDRNTEPSLPKRAAPVSGEAKDAGGISETELGDAGLARPLTDPLTDLPDRSNFWLELDSESSARDIHKVADGCRVQRGHTMTDGSSSEPSPPPPPRDAPSQTDRVDICAHGDGDSGSPVPSPARDRFLLSEPEAGWEESDPRPPPCEIPSWVVQQEEHKQDFQVSSGASPDRVHWYGSEEFLALPARIHESEILAINLESLAHAVSAGGEDVPHDALQDVDDWDLAELRQDNWDSPESGDDVPSPPFGPIRRNLLAPISPASSSEIAPSLDESVESGRLSEPPSEEEEEEEEEEEDGRFLGPAAPPEDASPARRLLDDVGRDRDRDPDVCHKMEVFVRQLDGFIVWLQGALESTRAWTPPPRGCLDALHDFLDTHLTFKLDVDSRRALKEAILEDGTALLAVVPAHRSGLRDILEMVSGQWEQLQLQIRRQHAWILRALRLVRTRLLPHAGQSRSPDRPQAELPSGRHEARRPSPEVKNPPCACAANGEPDSPPDFERWDGPTDADGAATEPRPRPFESSCSEVTKTSRDESTKRNSAVLPESFQRKVQRRAPKWPDMEGTAAEMRRAQMAFAASRSSAGDPPRLCFLRNKNLLSGPPPPPASAVPERLRASVEELKAWLRHTELLIFNSCLRPRREDDARRQLDSFKSLCWDVRARRRRVSGVLQLCQKLLQRNQSEPEAERRRDALRLLTVNLERRWEAVVMQTLQWQKRLKKELGESQVPGNFLEAGPADPERPSPDPAPSAPDDSWEWDETDMAAAAEEVPEPDLTHDLPCRDGAAPASLRPRSASGTLPAIYRVDGLHAASELPRTSSEVTARKRRALQKSLSKDSTFSSMESLPDLLGGLMRGGKRSESESGIASDAGDGETVLRRDEDVDAAMQLEEDGRGHGIQRASGTTKEVEELFGPRNGGSQNLDIPDQGQEREEFLLKHGLDKLPGGSFLSPGSSLESLLSLGLELFPSKEHLHRSASLESGLPELDLWRTRDEDCHCPEDRECGGGQGELSSGELSRRTLDLLERLENIQSPVAAQMTRSVSDVTLLRSGSPLGRRRRGSREAFPSLVRESSPSLAELSGPEESSLGSEDFAAPPPRGSLLPDRASARGGERTSSGRPRKRSGRREEADAVSLSMVVNVSCASACTDDEDDGDLLSSSTLTLTEEEMGVREEDEERLILSSSGNEVEAAPEESHVLGPDSVKAELRAWVQAPGDSSETEVVLWDELGCGTNPDQEHLLNSTQLDRQLHRRKAARSFISRFADDVENGNAEPSGSKDKDRDGRLLREESGLFARRGAAHANRGDLLGESFAFSTGQEDVNRPSSPSCELLAPAGDSSLVGQLKGELPCQSASPAIEEGQPSRDRKAITIREKFKFSSLVTEQSRSQLRDKRSWLPAEKWKSSHSCWCRQDLLPSPPSPRTKEAVRDFVAEMLDWTPEARRSKELLGRDEPTGEVGKSEAEMSPASLKHIRHKVALNSHQPLHLRQGDFYAYLSLSSHDSDCGEVAQRVDDKSERPAPHLVAAAQTHGRDGEDVGAPDPSPPPGPDIRDEETLFPACAEEVYLGPPLCYSVPPGNKTPKIFRANGPQGPLRDPEAVRNAAPAAPEPPRGFPAVDLPAPREAPKGPQNSEGETPKEVRSAVWLPAGEAGRAGAPSNEAPFYLNPRARVAPIDSSPAQCSPDTERLQSNIGAVMTEITGGGGGSATNPSKEPPASAARINPKINCRPIKEADRAAAGRRGAADAPGAERPQDGTAVEAESAVKKKQASAVNQVGRGRSRVSIRPIRQTGPGVGSIQLTCDC
ncbi:A-kinase anchor protein 6 isoform X4 [Syngnathoides biaculeatus]|uniref:A-kinase anchor protein 6 isoform X4 n=1 Tax=Syngnathoides biaculeatus TaxID=300417 RepID=UPI002ADE5F91|nr:A-kinase anchor protein 6 isoform X4 [Syngnathoides biaculeatus]